MQLQRQQSGRHGSERHGSGRHGHHLLRKTLVLPCEIENASAPFVPVSRSSHTSGHKWHSIFRFLGRTSNVFLMKMDALLPPADSLDVPFPHPHRFVPDARCRLQIDRASRLRTRIDSCRMPAAACKLIERVVSAPASIHAVCPAAACRFIGRVVSAPASVPDACPLPPAN